ncbi:MAG: glucosidase [Acidimicrobiales bacterium]
MPDSDVGGAERQRDRQGGWQRERQRLEQADLGVPWRRWGPYLAERAWGTVREDYSPDGDAWSSFPHDHARSRTYRWNEDGLAGLCDDHQFLCLSLALWNGEDPIMKERAFGLTGPEGNHGEDAKDYWFFLDATPTHSWMRWRYLYPQRAFPYADLVAENARRARADAEYELVDTGVFDGPYWEVTVDVAKADPEDLCLRIRARNVGEAAAPLHLVPTLWLRNTWSWGRDDRRAQLRALGGHPGAVIEEGHGYIGPRVLAGSGDPPLLFCENETNAARLFGAAVSPPFPKDGIHDHIVAGSPTVNPDRIGTKAALWYRQEVAAGATAEIRVRLAPWTGVVPDLGSGWERTMDDREGEADEWHAGIRARVPGGVDAKTVPVLRQAIAGMLWSKQYYHYDVEHWLSGDPTQPPPPPGRERIRNGSWRHLNNADVIAMPDTWEYPWYASWDVAFHCIALAHLDPAFAKGQLVLLCREWFMHPNGALPAYEWDFGDVNPPVLAYAAYRVWEIDGRRDYEFLERILHKLAINFTWWVNREDPEGTNVFEGGFLGLDNIAPFDRSKVAAPARLAQSDGTGWMAFYALSLLGLSLALAAHDDTYEDLATKFFEHFTYIAAAMDDQGLWNVEDGFYYDVLHRPDGQLVPLRVRSMVGLIPLFAVTVIDSEVLERLPGFRARMEWFERHRPRYGQVCAHSLDPGHADRRLLSVVSPERLVRILALMLDEREFLSPHGLRGVSRHHADQPFSIEFDGIQARVDYEPAESSTALFGGNSNWRGPVWFPLNHLAIGALMRFHAFLGPTFTVEYPTGSGLRATLVEVADDLCRRLVALFVEGPDGRRPVHGGAARFDDDPAWHDLIPFHEYFHGDTGAGLGASHQTGWTGLLIDMILGQPTSPRR